MTRSRAVEMRPIFGGIEAGGTMNQRQLLPLVRRRVRSLLGGYLEAREVTEGITAYIVAPGLDDRSGVLGAIALAERAWPRAQRPSP